MRTTCVYFTTNKLRILFRWSQGLLFHQGAVDCARAALLLPLGMSILHCQPVQKCSLVETAFLLLVTVATVNMLTTVLNDSPVFPEGDEAAPELTDVPLLMDSPQCVLFGTFMIWFASITINLGPTFLSGLSWSLVLFHFNYTREVRCSLQLNIWLLVNCIFIVITVVESHSNIQLSIGLLLLHATVKHIKLV